MRRRRGRRRFSWKLFKSWLFPFAFRVLSGIQNAFGYALRRARLVITTFAMLGLVILKSREFNINIVALLFLAVSAISSIVLTTHFLGFVAVDVHLVELIITSSFSLAMLAGGDDIGLLIASVYPGLILHKIFINLGSSQKWSHWGTDDKTGRTTGYPSLGIKIPRFGLWMRAALAAGSLVYTLIRVFKKESTYYLS